MISRANRPLGRTAHLRNRLLQVLRRPGPLLKELLSQLALVLQLELLLEVLSVSHQAWTQLPRVYYVGEMVLVR